MNTFALLTADRLQAPEPEPDFGGGSQAFNRRFIHQEPARLMVGNESGNDGGALQTLSEAVGIRVACSTVVRWYHGGINE